MRRARAVVGASCLVVVVAGCSIPEVDLEGRPCPCVDGYTCDLPTMTCVRGMGMDAGPTADGAMPMDAPVGFDAPVGLDAPMTEDSGGGGTDGGRDAGTCYFVDDFEDGALDGWEIEAGSWSASGGEARQSDASASLAYMFATATGSLADYRIRAEMRMLTDPVGGAMEVDFRVNPARSGEQYFCNWEPSTGWFLIMRQNAMITTAVLDEVLIDTAALPGYSPTNPVTMNVDVSGATIHCWLDEIPGADLTVTDTRYASGAVGFKTYAIAAAYEYLEVCPLP